MQMDAKVQAFIVIKFSMPNITQVLLTRFHHKARAWKSISCKNCAQKWRYALLEYPYPSQPYTLLFSHSTRMHGKFHDWTTHPMRSLPCVIIKVSECAPRLIEPPVPPTLRQMEHTQSFIHSHEKSWRFDMLGICSPDMGQGYCFPL
jgi:hypothetical protein